MDIRAPEQQYNPYRVYTREQWARLRDDTPMTLEPGEFDRLRSLHDRLDLQEVEDIYLPLSRLLSIYVDAMQRLYYAERQFLNIRDRKVPYIIGVAGSVAVGKSTTARVLQALLARWSPRPKVELITTDGFLYPNAVLERQGIMQKKGFPESYDLPLLLSFLSDIKAGRRHVRAPVYSHLTYDIVPNEWAEIDQPDILDRRGRQRAANRQAAARRQSRARGLRLLRFLGLYRCRRSRAATVVHPALPVAARHRIHQSEILLQPLRAVVGRGSHRHRDRDLGAYQPRQSRGQHPADPPPRDADPEEGRRPHGGERGAQAAVASSCSAINHGAGSRNEASKIPPDRRISGNGSSLVGVEHSSHQSFPWRWDASTRPAISAKPKVWPGH
ncbi:hypothetical protein ACVWWG_003062 [Bradyrhizobium sp. LB7.2]